MPVIRLYTDTTLAESATVPCDEKRAHYLLNVMRLKNGQEVMLFNGRDGEWQATLEQSGKKSAQLKVTQRIREQHNVPHLWLLCTPLKNGRTEWVVEKATELGVSHIGFVSTRYTNIHKVNADRLRSIAMEAAEQSERMDVPHIESDVVELLEYLERWDNRGTLFYGDESGGGSHPLDTMQNSKINALLVGPEGGFSPQEFALLRSLPFARAVTLGPRILRADTAAITMLALAQSTLGDWQHKPAFRS